jgi:hypothetical protein
VRKVRYSGLVEVMPYIGLRNWGLEYNSNTDAAVGVCIGTSHGIQLVDKFFLGMGTGINIIHNKVYVPFYYDFRLDFSKQQTRPFMSISLGWQIGDLNKPVQSVGVLSSILFGYRFESKYYLSAGFTLQNAMEGLFLIQRYGTLGIIAGVGVKF